MSPNKDETRSQSVARTVVDGRVFSLVIMYDGEIISALLMITNTLILVKHLNEVKFSSCFTNVVKYLSVLHLVIV